MNICYDTNRNIHQYAPNVSTKAKKILETLGAFGNIRGQCPKMETLGA